MSACTTIERRSIASGPQFRSSSEGLVTTLPLMGIHHIKFAVTDLDRSLHFYEAFLGANALRRPITGVRTMDRCTLTSSKCLG